MFEFRPLLDLPLRSLLGRRTINVEYNQLDPLLRASGFPDGDVNDKKTGYSPFPGNINQLVFELDAYVKVLERTKGIMPEFVNPKYTDETKTKFKKPTRLECMMQDFPVVLNTDECQKVGFTSVSASLCFSPVKNATEDGVKLQASGTHPGTAATGEADQYAAFRKLLKSIGCNVDSAKQEIYSGIQVTPGPAIVFKPDFACCATELEKRFPYPLAIHISARSTLFVRGSGVVIESLDLDGALIIDYKKGENVVIKGKVVRNAGWVQVRDESSSDEIIKMRGYRLEQKEAEMMTSDKDFFESCTIL
jgi:UDP-sugar pyrophosphorylase